MDLCWSSVGEAEVVTLIQEGCGGLDANTERLTSMGAEARGAGHRVCDAGVTQTQRTSSALFHAVFFSHFADTTLFHLLKVCRNLVSSKCLVCVKSPSVMSDFLETPMGL